MKFVGHVPESVSAAEASAVGQRSIEHLSGILLACSSQEQELRRLRLQAISHDDSAGFAELKRQTLATYNPDKAHALFSELSDNKTYQVPTLVWWRASASADVRGLGNDSRLKYVPAWARIGCTAPQYPSWPAPIPQMPTFFPASVCMKNWSCW
jgi:hypothetical protein